ncbi:MAG: CoA-transferase [Ramlibacter sp.]|nr:CoA-transferase [Ramlibacter sp.]
MGSGPLRGVRVCDFTWIGAGSYTTKLLADFGADVIKVESATRLDPLRATAPFSGGTPGVNRSGYFADRNSSKRAIRLNLKKPRAQEIARRLVAQSQVVTNNFSPGIMDKLGLGYERVSQPHPELVYLSMSMQGADGPHSDYVGFGLTIAALSGLFYLCGPEGRTPVGTGTNYPDHIPNPCHAAFAVLAALYHARRTGRGQFIDLSQTEPTTALLGAALIDYTANGRVAERCGNDDPAAAPRGSYPCSGGEWIAISVRTDTEWQALQDFLGLAATLPQAEWRERPVRLARRRELDAALAAATGTRDAGELAAQLQALGVAAARVADIAHLVQEDPQLAHRGHWVRLEHPEMGRTIYNAPPLRLSRTDFRMDRPAPLLGQHTQEVCSGLLGMSDDEIRDCEQDGVFD